MYRHTRELQFTAKPEKPDALFAAKFQEILGGQFGEMTVMMQYLFQGWNCRVPGKYKDMILDIGTEEISHVEMLTVMLARLLEGAPGETTEKAAAANPVLAAVLGGQNPQHAIVSGGGARPTDSQGNPWNAGYIIASGNLLTDFRSNAAAEGQSRLMTSRIANMTDDRGVKEMLAFNLARDTYHQQQWMYGIQMLVEEGFAESEIERSNGDWEDAEAAHVFYTNEGSRAGEGLWATGNSVVDGQPFRTEPLRPLTDDQGILPAPDPLQYVTYDGSQGPGKPGNAVGGAVQQAENVVTKVKDAITGDKH
ncbi:catalase [Kineococcus sp. T13]|uniref:manganese catalase family protein n=1 Tax=Kineococcus vitellinus TaxID=2696565 RepID=UPI001413629A|nr:catalase [Kineococcus vitellinus]